MLTKRNALERRSVLAGKRATSYGVMKAGPHPAICCSSGIAASVPDERRLDVCQEIGHGQAEADRDDLQQWQGDRFLAALDIADETAIDSELDGHFKLRHAASLAKCPQSYAEAVGNISGRRPLR
jgi:hypothetical protein